MAFIAFHSEPPAQSLSCVATACEVVLLLIVDAKEKPVSSIPLRHFGHSCYLVKPALVGRVNWVNGA